MLTQAPKGTQDMLPDEAHIWQKIEKAMRDVCALAGYREIRTPAFEHTELFLRGVGDTTDVVQKEMYTFEDKGGRSITLKPEGTAGAARAFIEAGMPSQPLPQKLYYSYCPVFRYEKPQAGRLREHHQLGVEVYGAKDASIDAEVIALAMRVLREIGIGDLKANINSLGCPKCRAKYSEALKEFLRPQLPHLCETCRSRFDRNPLRIIDCKVDSCKERVQGAPKMLDVLCDECHDHFEQLKGYLTALEIPFDIDPGIVRGLDYYTKTVFEIIPKNGGLTICGGGRYDGLIETLGGPEMCGIGFGMGEERLIGELRARNCLPEAPRLADVFVVTMGNAARIEGLKIVKELRDAGIRADMDHAARSMKAQFKYAGKVGAPKVIVIAEDELARGIVKVRDMNKSEEVEVQRNTIIEEMQK
ncbi:MAG: histidine--tRNA ligase [Clostridiales bacterium]|nr:histidine--tRNA ligase [Clostridiales bacterium]